jgi:hypothetical protein
VDEDEDADAAEGVVEEPEGVFLQIGRVELQAADQLPPGG